MTSKLALAICLALFTLPLAASAATPLVGTGCAKEKLGTTMRDTDDKNIIACLATDDAQQPYEWKAMSSSGGSGIMGGCIQHNAESVTYWESWGEGCGKTNKVSGRAEGPQPGYSCGVASRSEDERTRFLLCVKK